jgi:hypothetical protein
MFLKISQLNGPLHDLQGACKCKRFTLTLDLHTIYTAIDTYTRNTSPNPVLHSLKIVLHPKCCVQAIILVALRTLKTQRKSLQCSLCLLVLGICWEGSRY